MRRKPNHGSPAVRRRPTPARRGAAAVEFAFSASIVFFLFLSMIEVTRFHVVRHSLDQAVYSGARVGIVPGATAAEVRTAVEDRLQSAGVVSPSITITPTVIDETTRTVTVAASADYAQNSWAMPKLFDGATIDAQITLDHENVAFD